MTADDQIVLVESQGSVRTITLNRPDVLNAFNGDLIAGLDKAVGEADEDGAVRCLMIAGAGRRLVNMDVSIPGRCLMVANERGVNDDEVPKLPSGNTGYSKGLPVLRSPDRVGN